MKIYILLGHPDKESFNGEIFETFTREAKKNGHEIRTQCLGDLNFDPILRKEFNKNKDFEKDLKEAQENILWCEKWVIIYPIWWGSMPALLKGFFDRALYSGFAYKYHAKGPFWDKLLLGREALLITTCDAPNWWISWQYRNSDLNSIKRATLEFCGVKPVKIKRIDRVRFKDKKEREKILEEIKKLAK